MFKSILYLKKLENISELDSGLEYMITNRDVDMFIRIKNYFQEMYFMFKSISDCISIMDVCRSDINWRRKFYPHKKQLVSHKNAEILIFLFNF